MKMIENAIASSQTHNSGTGVTPLVFVEVTPLNDISESTPEHASPPCLSSPRVKLLLRRKTLCSTVSKHESAQLLRNIGDLNKAATTRPVGSAALVSGSLSFPVDDKSQLFWARLAKTHQTVPVTFLPSENPTAVNPIPCWIFGYSVQSEFSIDSNLREAIVSDSTLVRVLPAEPAFIGSDLQQLAALPVEQYPHHTIPDWKSIMTGESSHLPLSAEMIDQVLCNHDEETVRALSLRMSMLLSQPISIGTTTDALVLRHKHQCRQRAIRSSLNSYIRSKDGESTLTTASLPDSPMNSTASNKIPLSLQEDALIVHSPNHGAGKTLLVRAIAQERLGCDVIHIIQPTSLLAQYGIHADAALESLLHAIIMSAACQQKSVCIILDHLDAMLPPLYSGRGSSGDAAMPILKAIASYLKSLTLGLKRNREFLFPTKSPLYNLAGTGGHVLSANVCLVGIMTCEDDGGRSKGSNLSTSLDMLVAGRYRLPALSAKRRLVAFQKAFDRMNIQLGDEAMDRIPLLAASAVEARGRTFTDVASALAKVAEGKSKVSLQDLKAALATSTHGASSLSKVEFAENESRGADSTDIFASIGGNVKAKQAIAEALAIDPEKRSVLRSFGLSPPTGLLLYGAPGTGKTLLAKSVAKLLKSETGNVSSFGGSFITLQASEIVRGEVGNSEKMIVSAFETARSNAPSVVFIDEFQALFTERSGSGSGKLTSTLLQCMDDVCRWSDSDEKLSSSSLEIEAAVTSSRVVVMGATNTPWMIDKAFLRSGRFDRVVHVSLPALEERVSILRVHVARMKLALSDAAHVERTCQELAEACDGFSGADLAALCRAAAVECLADGGADSGVEERHFHEALKRFSPSCDVESVTRLAMWTP